ncbi:hypothetical protein RSOLAG22IIIB_09113 [Rhizoctonia solani]|uniref:Transmembrane protein n=1 Tax=Rhizoctonia solani TaxID=456999 RepID=A0A0K6FXE2_9AGAM|nr:hypothetical protein RSOLAG22IIIB_09113 [Rhizoctonia solani]
MQFSSAFSRLVAFALFMLSFSMLICAAPAPAPAALVVVTGTTLADLEVKLDVQIDLLNKCYNSEGCDCKPIIAQIAADIQVCIDIIAKLTGTIGVGLSVIVQLVVSIIVKVATACGKWVMKLDISV